MNGDTVYKLAAKVAWLEEQLQIISLISGIEIKPYKETQS